MRLSEVNKEIEKIKRNENGRNIFSGSIFSGRTLFFGGLAINLKIMMA